MSTICHITSKPQALDNPRILKECIALQSKYHVVVLGANAQPATNQGISILGFPQPEKPTFKSIFTLFRLALKQKALIYHLYDVDLLPLGLLLQWRGKKVVVDVNETYFQELQPSSVSLWHRILVFSEKQIRKKGAFILAQRAFIGAYQQRARKICVVEDFCDLSMVNLYQKLDRKECQHLLYTGDINNEQEATVMLSVLHELRHRGLDISLHIVGNSPDKALMQEMQAEEYFFGIKNHVTFHGPLPMHDRMRLSKNCFAGLYLKDESTTHPDIYPSAIFEYMGLGLPVVASSVGLFRAVVERRECGLCAPFNDIPRIADTIAEIYQNKELQEQFCSNGPKAIAQNYNWAHEKNILLDFYRKL